MPVIKGGQGELARLRLNAVRRIAAITVLAQWESACATLAGEEMTVGPQCLAPATAAPLEIVLMGPVLARRGS